MGKVRPLPEDVASRIAAGEVIERPASVLKELIENSIDAGASRVSVEIRGAGRKMIRVTDDGAGLDAADCRAAFGRHSTSKITDLSDIERLETFGFRGEALYSVAAVSRASLSSCLRGSRKAWRVEMDGGKLAAQREAPPVEGTTVEVCDLFFNTPARAKFLKSDTAERGRIARVVEEAALAHPGIAFVYKCEGRTVLHLAGHKGRSRDDSALRERIQEVLGAEYGDGLLDCERDNAGLAVRAFVSPVENLHSSRELQFFFVNRRPVVSRLMQQALYRAYEPFRPKNRHPAAVLFLRLPPDRIDVNVHPTKREVRFRPEGEVFETVVSAVSRALLESKGIPTLSARPRAAQGILRELRAGEASQVREAALPFVGRETAGRHETMGPGVSSADAGIAGSARYLGQIERSYLVFESAGGLLVMDQHAAQERVLFERYLSDAQSGRLAAQRLALPLPVDLPVSAIQNVLAQRERLKRVGFEVEAYGKTTLHVVAVPPLFEKTDEIREMVHSLLDGLLSPRAAAADLRYDATATIACKAAVKAHDPLSGREAEVLLRDLRSCKDPTCCPHGRPTMLSLDRDELARRFKRSGAPPL
ncbi:MAG: DNA mismatch repair endonuclease MutL [Elusimicrobiota bacterium]